MILILFSNSLYFLLYLLVIWFNEFLISSIDAPLLAVIDNSLIFLIVSFCSISHLHILLDNSVNNLLDW